MAAIRSGVIHCYAQLASILSLMSALARAKEWDRLPELEAQCAGVIERLIVTRVPVLIGEGIPLFGSLDRDIRLSHIATRSYPSGLVQSEYRIGQP